MQPFFLFFGGNSGGMVAKNYKFLFQMPFFVVLLLLANSQSLLLACLTLVNLLPVAFSFCHFSACNFFVTNFFPTNEGQRLAAKGVV